jgi:carbon storage regulator CsrA
MMSILLRRGFEMHVTTCGVNEGVVIGECVHVVVLEVHGNEVRLGISTPGEEGSYREETILLVQDGPEVRLEVGEPVATG